MRSLLRSFMGLVWDCPSADPLLNHMAADCGLLGRLRVEQSSISRCPPVEVHE